LDQLVNKRRLLSCFWDNVTFSELCKKKMKTFAYGSNMNIDRLQERTPSAVKVSNASIKGYKFRCNKVSNTGSSKGNIVFTGDENDVVWGVIYEIDDNEKPNLDRVEGLGQGYNQTTITVKNSDNQDEDVQVYVADPGAINENMRPFDWYRDFILSGTEQNKLPEEYIEELRSVQSTIDTNATRRESNYSIMGIEINDNQQDQ